MVPITRLGIAKELAERQDLYVQVQRRKYVLIGSEAMGQSAPVVRSRASPSHSRDEEKPFNPESFLGPRSLLPPQSPSLNL
jgi:hypothetical protein